MNRDDQRQRIAVLGLLTYERMGRVGLLGAILCCVAILLLLAVDLHLWTEQHTLRHVLAESGQKVHDLPPVDAAVSPTPVSYSPLVKESDLSSILADVAQFAQNNGLPFLASDYTWTPETGSQFGQYELQFELRGSYTAIRHFMQDLENHESAVAIRGLNLIREAGPNDLEAKFRIVIFTDGHGR